MVRDFSFCVQKCVRVFIFAESADVSICMYFVSGTELFSMFMKWNEDEESLDTEMMSSNNITVEYCQAIADNSSFVGLMKQYESFFMMSMMANMGVRQLTGLSMFI